MQLEQHFLTGQLNAASASATTTQTLAIQLAEHNQRRLSVFSTHAHITAKPPIWTLCRTVRNISASQKSIAKWVEKIPHSIETVAVMWRTVSIGLFWAQSLWLMKFYGTGFFWKMLWENWCIPCCYMLSQVEVILFFAFVFTFMSLRLQH